jgi:hypothetical protein
MLVRPLADLFVKVTITYESGRVLEGSAHLKSRAIVSQSASFACTLCLSLRGTS